MQTEIRQPDPSREFFFKEGCHILEMWNDPSDPEVSIARARVAPGVKTRCHRLKGTTERYLILSGKGQVHIGGVPPTQVTPGSVVVIPPDTNQSILNHGPDDLIF
ncbi:MAG TPA: cupin domain-containing protein, partial [Oceanipulchritudo sp.]|nr:cupin domain-containing protein [Oceanipulchritudo sp.]